MAGPRGDKVGDAWIEVTPILDPKRAKLEAQTSRIIKNFSDQIDKEFGGKLGRKIDRNLTRTANTEFQIQSKAFQKLQKQREDSIKATERMEKAAHDRRIKAVAHVTAIRTRQEKAMLDEAYKLNVEFDKKLDLRRRRRRGKDGGVLNFSESFENLASILPGQLEKLLRIPGITSVLAPVAAAIGAELISAAGGAIGAAVAGGLLTAGLAGAIAGDPELQKAGKALGMQFVDGFLESSSVLREEAAAAIEQISSSGVVERLNTRLRQVFNGLAPTIGPFIERVISGFDRMMEGIADFAESADPLIAAVGTGIDQLGGAIASFFKDLEGATPELAESLETVFSALSSIVVVTGKVIAGLSSLTSSMKNLTPVSIASGESFANVATGGGGFLGDITRGITSKITGFDLDAHLQKQKESTAAAAAEFVKAQNAEQAAANATSRSLEGQAAAFQAAHDAQKAFDRSIVTSLDHKIAYEDAIDDISNAIKDVKGNWKLTEPAVRNAINVAKSSLGDYKASLMDAVKSGKITRDEAIAAFNKMASNTVGKFGKGSEARKVVAEFAGELKTFPKTINVKVQVSSNIQSTLNALKGLRTSAGQTIRAQVQIEKNRANGGPIYGPGTGTSDSIPANLSNGEFVIKASSAKKIGMGNLARMNETGKMPQGFATGGSVRGQGRGRTASQVKQFDLLNKQIAALGKTLVKFNEVMTASTEKLNALTGLGGLGEGLTADQVVESLTNRRAKAKSFTSSIEGLKKKGLSGEALQDLLERGPESGLAETLAKASPEQIKRINALMTGDEALGSRLGDVMVPGGSKAAAQIAAKKKQAAKLAPPKAKGATISYAGGKTTALFSKKELMDQQLKAGTYVTVVIDGREVRAIVKEEQAKAVSKSNQKLKSGRR